MKMSSSHIDLNCSPAGLVISPHYPCLGVNRDSFTECECCGDGIVEIKCPFSVQDGMPEDLVGRKGSFLNDVGLIHTHKYHTQVKISWKSVGEHFVTCGMDTKWSVYAKDTQGPTLCGKNGQETHFILCRKYVT